VKRIVLLPGALKFLRRYRPQAKRVMEKVRACADDPAPHANNIKAMKGSNAKRLRVGEYRVIFEETSDEIIVSKIGPRGGVSD
jgi:mRNA interferase RelE/StbE